MTDAPARHRFRHPSGDTLHDRGRRARRGRATGPVPRALRPPVRQGAGPGSRLHLHQGADGLPRAQEHRADRPERRRRPGLGAAEVHQHRPLGPRRRPGRTPGRLRRRAGPHRRRQPDRGGRGGRRERLRQEGEHTAGVARQHNGRLGKEDNCQVGVFLVGVTPGGSALLDHQLYLPEAWCEPARPPRAPAEGPHPRVGHLRDQAPDRRGVDPADGGPGHRALDWITADEEYGKNGDFLDEVERLELRYVVEVPVNTTVWTEDPASCVPPYAGRGQPPVRPTREAVRSVAAVGAGLPAGCWSRLQVREGPKGPLAFEFAAVRAWAVRHRRPGPPIWLLIRRSLEQEPEVKYYVPTPRRGRRWGCWRGWPAPGTRWRITSRTPRATWGWRSTRRGRGSAGTIT